MSRGLTRAERLQEMERLYLQRAYSDSDLADRLSSPEHRVDRTTVYRDRLALEGRLPIEADEQGRYRINKMKYLPQIHVNLAEALSLYLAARRASQQTRTAQKATASALEKLALTLKQPMTQRLVRVADNILRQKAAPERDKVFETVASGWVQGLRVRVTYLGLHASQPYEDVISPYLIEPSPWSDSVYVIGPSDRLGKVVPYKLDRVQRAGLSSETFSLPADFDEQELLRHAWGIWRGAGEPVTVRLRFAPGEAARRAAETVWHPLEDARHTADGGYLWEAPIAEWREMLPWVRQWGARVEVLAPTPMRSELQREAQRLALLYSIAGVAPPPRYMLLWAKYDRRLLGMHPLACHMLDVAYVTLALWNDVFTERMRCGLAGPLGLDNAATGRLLAFWAALHDMGKASPAFQRKVKSLEDALSGAGLPFPKLFSNESAPHGIISTRALEQLLQSETGLARQPAKRIAAALGGHHGAWPPAGAAERVKDDQYGGAEWDQVRHDLFAAVAAQLQPPQISTWFTARADENRFLTLFSGLVSVADWIGSMEQYFPYASLPLELSEYAKQAREQARVALEQLGWLNWQPPTEPRRFDELFPFKPNETQAASVALAENLQGPSFVLIEAPTGSGKTEAALYLADHHAYAGQQGGMYVAMPTMATSNQMYGRVTEMLQRRYGERIAGPLLIHSQARWLADQPPPAVVNDDERPSASAQAMSWFLPRKRSLLAPFGVGTVDQSLVSVLQTRHFFVRLFALSHKTVIFDEVHAYDTYMSTLFQRLLGWLRAVDASVILLSATLPASTRRALVEAYTGQSAAIPDAPYPSITWAAHGEVGAVALPPGAPRTVALDWITRDPQAIVEELRDKLRDGGCAAVICNTVARSQEVYQAIRDAHLVAPADLILFHARTPFAWRDEVEREVLRRFGKTGDRPRQAIVVATQVIEQSLDLDFDFMITDLAPVDLVLQRLGRVHRHPRPWRPALVAAPRLVIALDADEAFPDFGTDEYVYEAYILLRSYLALRGRSSLTLPDATPALIAAVYDETELADLTPGWAERLARAQQKFTRDEDKQTSEAIKRLIRVPGAEDLLTQANAGLEEDAPEVHAAFQALTRLGEPSIALVCLHLTPRGLNTAADGSGAAVNLDAEPDRTLTGALARYTVNVSHRGVFNYFVKQEAPAGWREHPLLRDHRPAVFTDGQCPLPGSGYTLCLSRELGLEILKDSDGAAEPAQRTV